MLDPKVDGFGGGTLAGAGLLWLAQKVFGIGAKELVEMRLKLDMQAQVLTELRVRLDSEERARREETTRQEKMNGDLQKKLGELTEAINDLNIELASLRRRNLTESSDGGKR